MVTLKSKKRVKVGCVTDKVFRCLYSLLDLYLELKKSSVSDGETNNLERVTHAVNAHFIILWELKQCLLGDERG